MKETLFKIGIVITPFLFLFALTTQVKAEPYGWSPDVDNSWKGPPRCGDEQPKAPILYQPNHPLLPKAKEKGAVRLNWIDTDSNTENHNVYIGLSPKNYIQTAINVGRTNNFAVRFLGNRTYYFAVQGKKGCAASKLSNEWAGRPGGGGYSTLAASGGVAPVRKTYTAPKSDASATPTITTPEPTTSPSVQGIETGPSAGGAGQPADQGTYSQPEYNPPAALPVVKPVPPKPKSFWQNILSILFGK